MGQIYTYPSLQSGKQTLCGEIVMQGGKKKRKEGRDGQRKKISDTDTKDGREEERQRQTDEC